MKLLLDTHTFLWFVDDDPHLSNTAAELLESNNDVLISVVSLWEIAIKHSIGKLALPTAFEEFVTHQVLVNDLDILPIQVNHLAAVAQLPFHHRDPFDRLLIAQSIADGIPIVGVDVLFDAYGIKRYW